MNKNNLGNLDANSSDILDVNNQLNLPDENNSSSIVGNIRRNTALNVIQYFDGSVWKTFDISTGTNLWEVASGNLKPISPYTDIQISNIINDTSMAIVSPSNYIIYSKTTPVIDTLINFVFGTTYTDGITFAYQGHADVTPRTLTIKGGGSTLVPITLTSENKLTLNTYDEDISHNLKVDTIESHTGGGDITINSQIKVDSILANTIQSYGAATDVDLNFKTKGAGKFHFEVDPSPSISKLQYMAPNLANGDEIDMYIGKDTTTPEIAYLGYGRNTITPSASYCYFGVFNGVNSARIKIYANTDSVFPGRILSNTIIDTLQVNTGVIYGVNVTTGIINTNLIKVNQISENTASNGIIFNNNVWAKAKDANDSFAFFGTKAASPTGSGVSIENAYYPQICSRTYTGAYDTLQINCNGLATDGGYVKISNSASRIYAQAPLNLGDYSGFAGTAEGDLGFNYTTHEVVFYNGAAWKSIVGYLTNNNTHGIENNTYTYIVNKIKESHAILKDKNITPQIKKMAEMQNVINTLEKRLSDMEKKYKLFSDKVETEEVQKKIEDLSESIIEDDMSNSIDLSKVK